MFLIISPITAMIEVLIPSLKRGEILIHQKRDQLDVSVVTNIWVYVLFGLIVVMVLAMVSIW